MTIKELDRPSTGGQWCGSAWGYTARLRYGNSTMATWRGDLVPGSYCDRVLERCDTRPCRIQSPNYPGVYPRNVTCYYRIEHRQIPRGKHAMLAVRQRNSHKIHIKDQIVKYDRSQRVLRVWDQCNVVQDYLTVYDGSATTDPVLVRLCGGDVVPDIVSSGPNMLLEFHTSPFDNPFHPVPLSYLPGFELEVQIKLRISLLSEIVCHFLCCVCTVTRNVGMRQFPTALLRFAFQSTKVPAVQRINYGTFLISLKCINRLRTLNLILFQVVLVDSRSHSYVRDGSHCEFLLTSFDSSWGVLENPRHSLPPNTTCRYHFQGRRHETVWLSFVKYHAASADPAAYELGAECNARLRIWDGRIAPNSASPRGQMNVSLLGEFCKDEVPRLCDHSLLSNSSRFTRPCALAESYVSSGSELTLEQFLRQGSALYPVSFVLRYEFVDTSLEGAPIKDSANPCDRVFTSSPQSPSTGRFQSPRSVFFYGRGGSQNLSCVLRFEAAQGERVRLTFTRARFGDRPCVSRLDARTGRWMCSPNPHKSKTVMSKLLTGVSTPESQGVSELWVSEYPWPGVQLPRDCLCSKLSEPLVITTLTSSVVEVNFTVTFMNITQDFFDFYFEGEYQFLSGSDVDGGVCSTSREERRLRGSSGEIALRSPVSRKNVLQEPVVNPDVRDDISVSEKETTSVPCVNHPWLIEPEDSVNNFLYLKIRGYELPSSLAVTKSANSAGMCPTLNRIVVYSGVDTRDPKVVCPTETAVIDNFAKMQVVEVFSDGWNRVNKSSTGLLLLTPHARSFVVEFLEREPGSYAVTWMEVSKRPLLTASSSFVMSSSTTPPDCPYRCPELNACISAALWCDGSRHCPSGFDEEEANCAYQFGIPLLYVAIGAGALGVLALLIAVSACVKYGQHRRNERKKKKSTASNNSNHLHINHLHNNGETVGSVAKRYPTSADDMFMDGKDSLC
ncbi:hypothetical protein C0J52_25208 [Blattella germanica]|nr:hypothetical protein C0J52_25208 [Blattella germanica]